MSIQLRLNLLFGILLGLALVSMIWALVLSAGPRIRAENESIVHLTREFIETAAEALKDTADPAANLATLIDGLSDLRHAHVTLEGVASATPPPPHKVKRSLVRSWLTAMAAAPEAEPVRVPVVVGGKNIGTVVIAPQTGDEIGEVLDAVVSVTWRGLLLAAAVFALTSFVIHRALTPIARLDRALGTLAAGDYAVRLAPEGPPEFGRIASSLNGLATALERTRNENRWLSEKVIRVEDDERRELARELHDELGPYLFAVRAGASSLKREIEREAPDGKRVTSLAGTMLEQIDAIQRTNRRVLHKLRPVGLNELGLAASLEGIVAMWQKDHPEIAVALALGPGLDGLDDTVALTVHRVVQEGLTNVFRHAHAHTVAIEVERLVGGGAAAAGANEADAAAARTDGDRPTIRVAVRDDGIGLGQGARDGFGLTGMRERVWALGGTVTFAPAAGGGTLLEARLPASPGDRNAVTPAVG